MKTFTIEWLKKAKEDYEAAKTLLDSNFMHHSINMLSFTTGSRKIRKGISYRKRY